MSSTGEYRERYVLHLSTVSPHSLNRVFQYVARLKTRKVDSISLLQGLMNMARDSASYRPLFTLSNGSDSDSEAFPQPLYNPQKTPSLSSWRLLKITALIESIVIIVLLYLWYHDSHYAPLCAKASLSCRHEQLLYCTSACSPYILQTYPILVYDSPAPGYSGIQDYKVQRWLWS